jgi:flavin reductase (DIM6/NTAB) family NADH-FMN oxidoreductase RutF
LNGPLISAAGNDFSSALSAWAAGVTLLTIADDRDDIGTTVSAFMPVSLDPPMVCVSLIADSYPAEVLSRPSLPAARFALTLLASSQKLLAGQFAAAGRPSARLILDAVASVRGTDSGALIPVGGLAALECSVARRVPAGDHLLVISAVAGVAYVAEAGDPLIRFRGRYPAPLASIHRSGRVPSGALARTAPSELGEWESLALARPGSRGHPVNALRCRTPVPGPAFRSMTRSRCRAPAWSRRWPSRRLMGSDAWMNAKIEHVYGVWVAIATQMPYAFAKRSCADG